MCGHTHHSTHGGQRTTELVLSFHFHRNGRCLTQVVTWQVSLSAEPSPWFLPLFLLSTSMSHTVVTLFQCYHCVCARMYTHRHVCIYVCMYMYRPEQSVIPQMLSTLFFEIRPLTDMELANRLGWPRNLGDPSVSFQALEYKAPSCLAFVCGWVGGSEDPNSGPGACVAHTLPTEPSV